MKHILNKSSEIYKEIEYLAKRNNRIDIAVSFISFSGLQKIKEFFKGKQVRVITTTDQFITSPPAFIEMNKQGFEVKVFDGCKRDFHSKFFIFKGGEESLINGSLNLTNRALFNKYETVSVSDEIEEISSHFEELWNLKGLKFVDQKFIDDYSIRYEENESKFSPTKKNIKPNEMQKVALNKLKLAREEGKKEGFIQAATGTGKTFLAAFDTKEISARKILFVVHRVGILNKAMETFNAVHGKAFSRKINKMTYKNIREGAYFATYQSVKNNLIDKGVSIDEFDYVIVDEAHRSEASKSKKIYSYFSEYKFRLGMTATPERTDGYDVTNSFGSETTYKVDIVDALRLRYLSDFNYFGVSSEVNDNIITRSNVLDAVDSILRQVDSKSWWGTNLKSVIFVSTIEQAELLSEEINKRENFNANPIHSKILHSGDDLDYAIEQFESSDENEFLVTVDMFNEGIDIPSINHIILHRKTESRIVWLQQIGRGLRKYYDKTLTVLDFVGNDKNEFKRIENKTDSRPVKELIKDMIDGKVFDKDYNFTHLDKRAKAEILISLTNMRNSKKFMRDRISNISKDIKQIPFSKLHEEGYPIFDLLYQFGIDAFINTFTKYNFSKEFRNFIKDFIGIPFSLGDKKTFTFINQLLSAGESYMENKVWERLFSSEFNDVILSPYIEFDGVKFKFNKNKLSDDENTMIEELIEYSHWMIDNHSHRWMVQGESYTRKEVLFMSPLANTYRGLGQMTGHYEFDTDDEYGLILLNNVSSDKKYINRYESGKFYSHTKEAVKQEVIDRIHNKTITLYNFIRYKEYSDKFDGNRYILDNITNDYEAGNRLSSGSQQVITDFSESKMPDYYKELIKIRSNILEG